MTRPSSIRLALRSLVVVGLCVGLACLPARAQVVTVTTIVAADSKSDAASESKKKELPPMPTFSPEIEKSLADLMTKATEAKRKVWIEKMGKLIEKMATTTGVADPGRKKLEASSHEVVETCLVDWPKRWERMVRNQMKQYPAEARAAALAEFETSIDQVVRMGRLFGDDGSIEPEEQSGWADAVKGVLTAAQLAAWEKILAEDRQKLKAEIGDHLNAWLAPGREAMEQSIFSKTDEMSRTLNLPKERTEQLKSLAKNAAEAGMAKWKDRQEKWFADMAAEQRQQLIKSGNIYFYPNADEFPEEMPVWKEGLAKLLSADERKRLEAEAADHRARSARALTRLLVAEIDTRVALTPDQRQRIEPICDRLATKNVGILSPVPGQPYSQIDIIDLLSTGLKSSETEVRAILEPIQWRHWVDACNYLAKEGRRSSVANVPKQVEQKPMLPSEPEDYERILANYLEEQTQRARQKAIAASLLSAEDAGRASNLPAEKVELLKTAARGAVEESLRNWKSNVDQNVRGNLGETSARFLQGRLANMQTYYFQQRLNPPPESQAIWVDALKANLDAQQAAAAAKSVSERETFKSESIAAFVVAMFDQSHHLTAAQQPVMTTAVAKAVQEYQADIGTYFSGYRSTEWYLQGYTMFLPVAAVPETELKSILGPECFDSWTHSAQYGNTMTYWVNLKENHDARAKAAAAAKKK